MHWISTIIQLANIGTKNNPGPRHQALLELLHVRIGNLSYSRGVMKVT